MGGRIGERQHRRGFFDTLGLFDVALRFGVVNDRQEFFALLLGKVRDLELDELHLGALKRDLVHPIDHAV